LITERRDFVVTIIQYLARRMGATPSVPLEALAMGIISLSEGVRLFGAASPNEMTAEVADSILDAFINSVLQHVMQTDKREPKAPRASARKAAAPR
jgi:hypothetical protein